MRHKAGDDSESLWTQSALDINVTKSLSVAQARDRQALVKWMCERGVDEMQEMNWLGSGYK